jgi:glutamate formiminotransferase/formiminotetrahydrofolate cyclodeaminase
VETLESYLEALASAQPTPGGGSAAAIVGATGAALIAMVARITAENPKYADRREEAEAIVERADALRASLLAAREADEIAYGGVVTATALPRETTEQKERRTVALQAALRRAAQAPLETALLTLSVMELAAPCARLGNKHLTSDVFCAIDFTRSALTAAARNVRANHPYLHDLSIVSEQEARVEELLRRSEKRIVIDRHE